MNFNLGHSILVFSSGKKAGCTTITQNLGAYLRRKGTVGVICVGHSLDDGSGDIFYYDATTKLNTFRNTLRRFRKSFDFTIIDAILSPATKKKILGADFDIRLLLSDLNRDNHRAFSSAFLDARAASSGKLFIVTNRSIHKGLSLDREITNIIRHFTCRFSPVVISPSSIVALGGRVNADIFRISPNSISVTEFVLLGKWILEEIQFDSGQNNTEVVAYRQLQCNAPRGKYQGQ